MIIKSIAKSNVFLFPGSYYIVDVDRLETEDQDFIYDHEDIYRKESDYIFVEYTFENEHYYENDGVLDGVLGRFEYFDGALTIHILCKATVYPYDNSNDAEMFIEPFVRKISREPHIYDEIELLMHRKENINYGGIFKESHDRLYDNKPEEIQLLGFMNHIFDLDNSLARHTLFENYHYDFYIELVSKFLKLIKGYKVHFSMFNNDIEDMIKDIVSYLNNHEEKETRIYATDRFLDEDFFYNIELAKIDADINLDLIEGDEYKSLLKTGTTEEDIINIFMTKPIYDKEKEQKILSNQEIINNIFSLFKEHIKEDAYLSSVFRSEKKGVREDLWTNAVLNPLEREKVYYDFIQMNQTNFYSNFKKLNYIPSYVRNMFDSHQTNSGKDYEKERKRMLAVIRLPWAYKTVDNPMNEAEKLLNKGHFGLNDIKTKILEYLTYQKFTKNSKPKILCLAGPPGVGKSSIAKNIAKALNRKFCSISLGSISTELDLQGANQTYSGASAGGIIQQLIYAGSSNPVFLLDEIDKVPQRTSNGNVIGILMSILDPTLNKEFIDSFIQVPYNLSQILFVCTANDVLEMSPALLNRVELIYIHSYSISDKIQILKKYIIPDVLNNLKIEYKITFSNNAIELIARKYALDSGMRESVRIIESIISKILMTNNSNKNKEVKVDQELIQKYLGDKLEYYHNYSHNLSGIVNLLAATETGGKVMKLEINSYEGKGEIITTGNLGKIIKESVNVALGYLQSNYKLYNIDSDVFVNKDIHFHFSDNASLKDGSSAGVGVTIALLSHIKNIIVSNDIAFTGEITLKGKILPIGSLINKLSVCAYEGVKKVYLPLANKSEVLNINKDIIKNVEIVFVDKINDLIDELLK